jgi:hypothetical protein
MMVSLRGGNLVRGPRRNIMTAQSRVHVAAIITVYARRKWNEQTLGGKLCGILMTQFYL